MDPRDFLGLARGLLAQGDAASCRTAISRSYYAAHHVAAAMLGSLDFIISNSHKAHSEVVTCLSAAGDPEVMQLSYRLDNLRAKRNDADYRLGDRSTENPKTTDLHIKMADAVVRCLDACGSDAHRLQRIREAMRDSPTTRGVKRAEG